MRKTFLFLALLIAATTATQAQVSKYDINSDGLINGTDLTLLADVILHPFDYATESGGEYVSGTLNFKITDEEKREAEVSGVTDMTTLTKTVIPDSIIIDGVQYVVTSIGKSAFSHCFSLTSVTIPTSVKSIGDLAFRGCVGLTSLTIPISVTSIGEAAFSSCTGLICVTIGECVTSIGSDAFRDCSSLTEIFALRTNPAEYNCNNSAFTNLNAILHVPAGCKDAYSTCEPWRKFENIKDYWCPVKVYITVR